MEENYRTVLDSMDEGFLIAEVLFDTKEEAEDYRCLEVNPAFYKHTGLQEDIVGKTMREIAPDTAIPWLPLYGQVVKTRQAIRFEYDIEVEQLRGYYDIQILPLGDTSSHRVAVLFQNITERKRREKDLAFLAGLNQELMRAQTPAEVVQISGDQVGRFFGASVCAFIEISDTGEKAIVFDEWHRPGGPSLIGTYDLRQYVNEEYKDWMSAGQEIVVRNAREDGRLNDREKLEALRIGSFVNMPLARDGKWKYALGVFHEQPYNWQDDELVLMQDMTARIWNRLERARIEAALQQQKDDFIGIASHELRTPMTSIKLYGQVLQQELNEEGDRKNAEVMQKMNTQIDRLTILIHDLLDTTCIAEGTLPLKKQSFQLNDLINECIQALQHLTPHHHIKASLSEIPVITADRERIQQVVVNLLSNAIKYSPGAEEVWIRSGMNGNMVKVCIEDKGIGIPPEVRNKIFDRFFRVDSEKMQTYPGMGLGLFISAGIIKRHGGSLTVDSEEDKGSIFCFTLPAG